jgi:hypothetical protein
MYSGISEADGVRLNAPAFAIVTGRPTAAKAANFRTSFRRIELASFPENDESAGPYQSRCQRSEAVDCMKNRLLCSTGAQETGSDAGLGSAAVKSAARRVACGHGGRLDLS